LTEAAPDPYRWVVLAAATVAQTATAFVLVGIGALAAFFRDAYDLSGAATGLVVTAAAVAPVFALLPVGRILDHHSERPIISGGAVVMGAGAAAAAFVSSYPMLLLVLAIGGIGYATAQPGGSKVVAMWFPDAQRGMAMGIRQTGLPLGGAVAAATLPAIAEASGLRTALLVAAGVSVAGGILFYVLDRHPPLAPDRSGYRLAPEIRHALGDPVMRRAVMAGLAMVSAQFAVIGYLILYLRDDIGIPVTTGAWILFATQMGGVAGRVALAAWSDRARRGRTLAITTSIGATSAFLVVLALVPHDSGLLALATVAALLGFFGFGWYGPWVVHVAEIAPSRSVGLTLAVAMTGNQLGIVLAPPLFGVLLDASGGYVVPWLAVAGFLALVAWRTGSAPSSDRPPRGTATG
jgi:predicted MFS family arabinose efflux permease